MTTKKELSDTEITELKKQFERIKVLLTELDGKWVHSESDARFVLETLRDISRHVANISLHLKGY